MKSIHDVAKQFHGCLLDAYGVFWGGNAVGPLPGAKEAMQRLVQDGKIVGILSNATQSASNEIEKLKRHGIHQSVHYHFFITSGHIARLMINNGELPFPTPKKRFCATFGAHPKFSSYLDLFQGSPFVETQDVGSADFLFASIPHLDGKDQTDPNLFRPSLQKFQGSLLPMLCVNPDRFAHEGSPAKLVVRQGSLASLYEEMGGSVFYIGKPSKRAYSFAMDEFAKFGIKSPRDVLMVGDTPETDIRGANFVSMPSCLLTATGVMAERLATNSQALTFLEKEDQPDFLLERLV